QPHKHAIHPEFVHHCTSPWVEYAMAGIFFSTIPHPLSHHQSLGVIDGIFPSPVTFFEECPDSPTYPPDSSRFF
ncbi:MAG: hypothetical protein WAU17_07275, partial [Nitrospirales bacterium]